MKNEAKFWDRASKNYDKGDKIDNTYLKMLEIMKKYLHDTDTLMDFGCATGSISIDLSGSVRKVIGIDISSEMIKLAKEKAVEHKADNVYFTKSTIFDERHKRVSFDAIMAFNILHLLDDPDKAIKRINDLMKDGGVFISNTACLADKGRLVSGMMTLLTKMPFLPNVKNFKVSELKNIIEKNGFEILESMTFEDDHHPFIIARKNG
jgi:ubiquinone/menaquinone biosynthesis C-methylase UbiE